MPFYLSIGVQESRFWDGTPKDLEPYIEAHKLRQKENDLQAWRDGLYILSAVQVGVEHVLAGRKARSKYIEKAFSLDAEEKEAARSDNLTDDEKQKYIEHLFLSLKVMQGNFDRTHQDKQGS